MSSESSARAHAAGVAYALGAYVAWGLFPAYWKLLHGVAVETSLATPAALLFLVLFPFAQEGRVLGDGLRQSLLLVGTGVATALPLLWFAHGARRLRFATLGLFQYISPTLQLALATLAYGEAFTSRHALTFGLIWGAVGLYALDGLRGRAAPPPAAAEAPRRAA